MQSRDFDYAGRYRAYAREQMVRFCWDYAIAWLVLLAAALMIGMGAALIRQARSALDCRRVPLIESGHPSIDKGVYPDPVCPWCGGLMDGHGCRCKGVGL